MQAAQSTAGTTADDAEGGLTLSTKNWLSHVAVHRTATPTRRPGLLERLRGSSQRSPIDDADASTLAIRGRVLVGVSLLNFVNLVAMVARDTVVGGPAGFRILLAATAAIAITPAIFRRVGVGVRPASVALVAGNALIVVVLNFRQGLVSPGLVWLVVQPLIAMFLLGPRAATLIATAMLALLALLAGLGPHTFAGAGVANEFVQVRGILIGLAVVFVTVLGWIYERSRRNVLDRLESEQASLAALIKSSPDPIFSLDRDGNLLVANAGAKRFFTAMGARPEDVDPAATLAGHSRWKQRLDLVMSGSRVVEEDTTRLADTDVHWELCCNPIILPSSQVAGATVFARDITEHRLAERQIQSLKKDQARVEMELRHAQKLEAVGQLASGIAHEINTPIQFVGDTLGFLRDACDDIRRILPIVQDVVAAGALSPDNLVLLRDAAENADLDYLQTELPRAFERGAEGIARVATLVRGMKEFAHPSSETQQAADLNRALTTTATVARNEYKYVADLNLDLGEIPPVVCHLADLNQVFLNLIINAAHAIGERNKGTDRRGTITVRTTVDGGHVVIAVTDTGAGIPPSIRARVFEPFFTTKEVGRGTGQGLAISRSVIVDRHGGTLTFDSEVGIGTTFTIRLPVEGSPHGEVTSSDGPTRNSVQ